MRTLLVLIGFVATLFGLVCISVLYEYIRTRLNKPKIGHEPLIKLLRKDDYVSINGRILTFSHIAKGRESLNLLAPPSHRNQTDGGELAFLDNYTLGYVYYHPAAMSNCDFIYGKYGLKWARNNEIATTAKNKIYGY